MNCRHCRTPLQHTFIDLGFAPPSNAYLTREDLSRPELYFPLKVKVCGHCWLVQTEDYADAKTLFTAQYAYFSSTSEGWLTHAKKYCERPAARLRWASSVSSWWQAPAPLQLFLYNYAARAYLTRDARAISAIKANMV